MKNAPRTIQGLNIFRLWLHYSLYLCSFMDSYTFLYTLMEECEFTFESVRLETSTNSRAFPAGQQGKRDFFPASRCSGGANSLIRDSASWANSVVMFSQSLCFTK